MTGENIFNKNGEITGEKSPNLEKDALFTNLNEPFKINLSSFSYIISFIASGFMIFGGIVPYVPQYRIIQRSRNATGFSNLVCLALLIANILRILFWFGHPFEMPLFVQSLVMIFTMLIMLELCIRVNGENIHQNNIKKFTDFDTTYFWKWSDFKSYLHFLLVFTLGGSILTYLLLDVSIFIETLGNS